MKKIIKSVDTKKLRNGVDKVGLDYFKLVVESPIINDGPYSGYHLVYVEKSTVCSKYYIRLMLEDLADIVYVRDKEDEIYYLYYIKINDGVSVSRMLYLLDLFDKYNLPRNKVLKNLHHLELLGLFKCKDEDLFILKEDLKVTDNEKRKVKSKIRQMVKLGILVDVDDKLVLSNDFVERGFYDEK